MLALAAAAPASARIQVVIDPDLITVASDASSATVTRDPFAIDFYDNDGRKVLSHTPNGLPGPTLIPPVPDPPPLGSDVVDGPTTYSPLVFTVGAATDLQYPSTPWVGNRFTGLEAGLQFSARRVESAVEIKRGVRMELSTNDPTGRLLVVEMTARDGGIAISADAQPASGVVSIGDSFASEAEEAFRGFGGRHNALDQRGNDFYNWVEQQNTGAGPFAPGTEPGPGTGGPTYLFPNGPTGAYYVQSQFVSSQGYGFLLDRDELSGWRMASDRDDAWQVSAAAAGLDYLVAPGAPRVAMRKLTALTGRHRTPPSWALAPQFDRLTKFTGETAATYKASVKQDLKDLRRYRLPIRAYRIEAWAWLETPFLRKVIRRLHRRGIKALLYFRPFVGKDEIGTDLPRYYDEAIANDYVAETATGDPYIYVGNFNNLTAQIDFTDPAARKWWRGRVRRALRLGADGFMQDFGEQVQNGMHFDNGETGATMHNRYPVLFHKTTASVVRRFERKRDRRIWWFTRSGYSGTPGSAAYEGSNFPGDETTDWSRSSGLASLTTDMLNRAIGGAYGFGADIGGYFDFHTPPTTKELFIRWAEWSALSPVFRLHGSINAGTHAPWTYDRETVRIYKRLSRLHLRARPLIKRLWRRAVRTGVPPTRPLWLAYPGDEAAAEQDQEWMLGRNVLVAPVVSEGASGRDVYFPAGCWKRAASPERFTGPASQFVEAPLGTLPWFKRCGSRGLR